MELKIGNREKQPTQPVSWPNQTNVLIQQIKAASQPSRVTVGPVSQVQSANMPQPVAVTSVIKLRLNSTTRQLLVSFVRDPADTYFQKVNVHLRQGNGQIVQIASGTTSPIRVNVPSSVMPSTVFLQTEGSWGANPIENSPARALSLM